jgi:hypothetical protein
MEQLSSHRTDFHEILFSGPEIKSVKKNSGLFKVIQTYQALYMKT